MTVLTVLHQHAPLIQDWCPVCAAFGQHDNGFIGPPESRTAATVCRRCQTLLLWPG